MNLKEIKIVINSDLPDDYKKAAITMILAKDKDVIPNILSILSTERKQSEEILLDTNEELSRALILLMDNKLVAKKGVIVDPKWVVGKIKEHYRKWKGIISCNFPLDLDDGNN